MGGKFFPLIRFYKFKFIVFKSDPDQETENDFSSVILFRYE